MITVRNKGIFCLLLAFCVFLMSSCNLSSPLPPDADAADGKGGTTEIIVPGGKTDKADEKQAAEKAKNDEKKNEKSDSKKGTQNKPFWQASKVYDTLTAVAAAAQQDYKVNGAKRGWMSKNGKLYGYYDGCYITPDMLVKEGYLESGLDTSGFELLLIDGEDLAAYNGASVSSGNMNFGVFAAVKQNGKYLLASPSGKAGQIVQSDYQSLLAKYNQSHGNIGRLSSATAEYGRILNYICLYEGRFADYYVREIRKDNKYAVVVFSTTGNTANIKEYVLKNDNGFWEVVYPMCRWMLIPLLPSIG